MKMIGYMVPAAILALVLALIVGALSGSVLAGLGTAFGVFNVAYPLIGLYLNRRQRGTNVAG